MNDKEIEKNIIEILKALPPVISDSIASAELDKLIEAIGDETGLRVDQMGELYTQTVLVLLGLSKSDNFPKEIEKNLGISQDRAKEIADMVGERVFKTILEEIAIREELDKKVKALAEDKNTTQKVSTAAQNPQLPNSQLTQTPPPNPSLTANMLNWQKPEPQKQQPSDTGKPSDPYREMVE